VGDARLQAEGKADKEGEQQNSVRRTEERNPQD
jgi:hypothetical protein